MRTALISAADQAANVHGGCGPRLNKERDAAEWPNQAGSPKARLANEKPRGETVDCDALVKRWASAK